MSDVQTEPDTQSSDSSATKNSSQFKPLRIWPPLLLVTITAVMWLIPRIYQDASVGLQMAGVLCLPLCGILILLWWILFSRATAKERVVGFLGVGISFAMALLLIDKSMIPPGVLLTTIPMGMAAFTVGAILFSRVLSFKLHFRGFPNLSTN